MDSASHRRVMLGRRYLEVGVGVALGVPFEPAPATGATYAAEFGFVTAMSTTTVILLIVGVMAYVAFVALVLSLLTVARRADEETERHVRASRRFARPGAAWGVDDVRRRSDHHVG